MNFEGTYFLYSFLDELFSYELSFELLVVVFKNELFSTVFSKGVLLSLSKVKSLLLSFLDLSLGDLDLSLSMKI